MFDKLYQYRNKEALFTSNQTVKYCDIIENGVSFLKIISNKGLCALVAKNCIASVTAYISLIDNNIPVMLINETNKFESFLSIFDKYKPEYIIIDEKYSKNEELSSITDKVFVWIDNYIIIKTNYNIDYDIYNGLSVLMTTSGTTGSSKFVRLSKENLEANTLSITDYLHICADDRVITTLPFAYSYGLSIINTHLYNGASVILTNSSVIQKEFWDLLHEKNATTFGGVPYTYEMMQRLRFERINIPNISYITQAGGRLNTKLTSYFLDECAKKNIKFFKMYGQTEATARISYLEPEYLSEKTDSIGKAIPNGELFVADENNNYLGSNETGELIYKGDNVCLGYAESCYDLYKGDENNGILHTGDIGYYDKDGFFYITGRKKRFLKVFGNRINLDELENKLNINGCLCACSGIDDKIKIYVCSEDMKNKAALLLKDKLDIHPSGYSIEIIKEIPRNSAGKIQYSLLG